MAKKRELNVLLSEDLHEKLNRIQYGKGYEIEKACRMKSGRLAFIKHKKSAKAKEIERLESYFNG